MAFFRPAMQPMIKSIFLVCIAEKAFQASTSCRNLQTENSRQKAGLSSYLVRFVYLVSFDSYQCSPTHRKPLDRVSRALPGCVTFQLMFTYEFKFENGLKSRESETNSLDALVGGILAEGSWLRKELAKESGSQICGSLLKAGARTGYSHLSFRRGALLEG